MPIDTHHTHRSSAKKISNKKACAENSMQAFLKTTGSQSCVA